MSEIAWELSHSVETTAPIEAAWAFMTNVANWSDPPATFELDGPFAAGARGTTRMPEQPPLHWLIAGMRPLESYAIEGSLGGATMTTEWSFAALGSGGTRLTQRMTLLRAPGDSALAEQARAVFGENLAPGMERIAGLIDRAAGSS